MPPVVFTLLSQMNDILNYNTSSLKCAINGRGASYSGIQVMSRYCGSLMESLERRGVLETMTAAQRSTLGILSVPSRAHTIRKSG